MPFDSMPESVRIRYVAAARGLGGRIRAYETWRDCHPDDLAQTLAYIRRFDRARRIMTEPAPPPRQIGEWRFTDMAGNVSGWSDYWTGKPPAPTKVDCYGMTAETRRQHRAADQIADSFAVQNGFGAAQKVFKRDGLVGNRIHRIQIIAQFGQRGQTR